MCIIVKKFGRQFLEFYQGQDQPYSIINHKRKLQVCSKLFAVITAAFHDIILLNLDRVRTNYVTANLVASKLVTVALRLMR